MKISRACCTAGFLILGFAGVLRADDGLRHYQQALRDQGFYYGPINGATSDETTQALRRYQIRNGLAVNGELNDETRRSIDKNAAEAESQPTPGPLATPTPARRIPPTPPTPAPAPRSTPRQIAPPDDTDARPGPPPDRSQSNNQTRVAPSAPLTNYFGGTPYEFAPPPVQADTIARAQKILSRSGFYDGDVDGRPNHDLAEALSNFQEVNRLRRSGRLDTNTLAALRLLPDRRNGPVRRDDAGNDRRGSAQIYDGRIVR